MYRSLLKGPLKYSFQNRTDRPKSRQGSITRVHRVESCPHCQHRLADVSTQGCERRHAVLAVRVEATEHQAEIKACPQRRQVCIPPHVGDLHVQLCDLTACLRPILAAFDAARQAALPSTQLPGFRSQRRWICVALTVRTGGKFFMSISQDHCERTHRKP